MSNFSNGDVEAVTQPVFQTLNDVTLVFEGVGVLNVYFKREDSDSGH